MAIGDQAADLQSISSQAYLTIRPGVGAEWKISNIFFNGAVNLYFVTDALSCMVANYRGSGRWAGVEFIVSNTYYVKLKNVSDVAKFLGFVGEVTK